MRVVKPETTATETAEEIVEVAKWVCGAAAVPTWEDSFEELSRYHATHRHYNLSQLEGRLGRWVARKGRAFCLRKGWKVG